MNSEEIKAKKREYMRQYLKERRLKNPEANKESCKLYRIRNADKIQAYKIINADRIKEGKRRYYLKKKMQIQKLIQENQALKQAREPSPWNNFKSALVSCANMMKGGA